MAYKDMLLPKAISFGGMGGPTFSTGIVQVESGFEFPNQNWTYPLARYEVSHAARLPAQWIPLRSFFYIAAGRANTWNYWDPLDYAATAAEGVFLQLTSTTFQAYKKYTFGSYNALRRITKFAAAPTVTGGASPTWSLTTGVLTVASGTPLTWASPLFYVHARFDIDALRYNTIDKKGNGDLIVGWQSIPICEVRD